MKQQYDFTCPKCEHKQFLHKSMAMEMGINTGSGSCLKCKTFLHLEITPDLNGEMAKAIPFDDWLKSQPSKNN